MKRIRVAAITLTSLALLAVIAPTRVAAATDAFLVFGKTQNPALAVTGEAVDKAFPGTIEVKEFSYGVENPTTIGSTSGGAGETPEEQVTLAYGAMSVQYSVQDETGKMQPAKPFQWNQITNTPDIEKLVR